MIAIDGWDEALGWVASNGDLVDPAPYEFSKEVVQVWTMHSSRRSAFEFGVRTNSVCPGVIDTPLLPHFRRHMSERLIDWAVEQSGGSMLSAEAVARVLLMLGSDASEAINGHNTYADQGLMAWLTTNQLDFSGLA